MRRLLTGWLTASIALIACTATVALAEPTPSEQLAELFSR